MQYEKDITSPFVSLFQEVRSILLELDGIEEQRKRRITTYLGEKGGLCHVRTTATAVDIGFLKGAKFVDEHHLLKGNGKALRVLSLEKMDRELVNYYLKQGLTLIS